MTRSKPAPKQTPLAEQLASINPGIVAPEVIGSNLTPEVVPNTLPEPTVTASNKFTEAAHACAVAIQSAERTAAQSRYAAWVKLANCITNIVELELCVLALKTECRLLELSRYEVEASEFKAFAIVYHYDKTAALRVVDVTKRHAAMKGDKPVTINGQPVMVTRTTNEIVRDIRIERDRLKKQVAPSKTKPGTWESIIPDDVYKMAKPRTAPAKDMTLSSTELVACAEQIGKASAPQLVTLLEAVLARVVAFPNKADLFVEYLRIVRQAQVAAGCAVESGRELVKGIDNAAAAAAATPVPVVAHQPD